jgi:predicted DNA-binding transcriptional regulator AlpA
MEVKHMGRIIRKPELFGMIGLSEATIWRMEKAGNFPRRIQLGGGNSVGWFFNEIEAWLAAKAENRGTCRRPGQAAAYGGPE